MEVELYTPLEHQYVVHQAITEHIDSNERNTDGFQKIFVVKAMRQVGKSAMAINELMRFSLTMGGTVSGYVAPTLKLSRKTYNEIRDSLLGTGLMESYNGTDLQINMINGSSINFFSAEQRDNLRGFTISGLLVIDEAAFIPDDIYNEHLSPWCDFHKAVTLIISTPQFYQGFFYNLYISGLNEENDTIYSFDWSNFDVSSIRSERTLEEKRRTIPRNKFNAEYLGVFIKGDGSVFGDFKSLIKKDIKMTGNLYFGLDWATGSGQDSTVLSAFNNKGELCYIWSTNQLDPTSQVEHISSVIKSCGSNFKTLIAENNSIGEVYRDMLVKNKVKVTPFVTTNDSKRKLVEDFQVAIEQEKIILPDNPQLELQLSAYESKVNSNGKITYNAPSGMHDDYVISAMLAYRAFKQRNNSVRISFT